ncbi:MAG TPA: nucleotide disphospho-sugar-binding domain-containing protein, partial [Acidimicrobiia bacterium]|nr:nucleotide disphospho-sugar-binding domain-containing protein [Acidimicrobiia bacterium]
YIDVLCAAAGGLTFPPLTGMARLAWVTNELFIGAAARRMLPDVITTAQEWSADLVVRQSLEYSGCVAAERLGLPHASVADAAHSALDRRHEVAASLNRLRSSVGLPSDPHGEMVYRYLHLCFAPPRFDGPGAVFPPTAHFLRHTNPTVAGEQLPSWMNQLEARPTVLVSMGTVFHRTAGIYEAVVEGLRDEPVNLVVAAGFDEDPGRFGPQPPNVRVERYLPLTALLPRCDLFVTHGGFNSVKESLAAGVPMVVIPISADQPYSAERCAALGVGVAVGSDGRSPVAVRQAVRTVLADQGYKRRAREMQDDMAALPGPQHAVALLEALHRNPVPRQPAVAG